MNETPFTLEFLGSQDQMKSQLNLKNTSAIALTLLCVSLVTGCATSFHGNAHVDRAECEKRCESWGMELSRMVAVGEYSSGCVCKDKGKDVAKNGFDADGAIGVTAAATVGMATAMQQQQLLQAGAAAHQF